MMKMDKYFLHFWKAVTKMGVEKVFWDLEAATKWGTGLTLDCQFLKDGASESKKKNRFVIRIKN